MPEGRGWCGRSLPSPHPDLSPPPVKPSVPQLSPVVDFSEDEPLEASIEWTPPSWPSHKVLICQFRYQSCLEEDWVPVSGTGPLPPTLTIPAVESHVRAPEPPGLCHSAPAATGAHAVACSAIRPPPDIPSQNTRARCLAYELRHGQGPDLLPGSTEQLSKLPANTPMTATRGWLNHLGPCADTGDLDGAPGFSLACHGHSGRSQRRRHLSLFQNTN